MAAMESAYHRVLAALRSWLSVARHDDLIPITVNGFWKHRRSPRRSLHAAAKLFEQRGGKIVVEIGTGLHGKLAGNSIEVWPRRTHARRIIAVDMDPERIASVQALAARHPNIELMHAEGIDFLTRFDATIDLLYLDFWMPDPHGSLVGTGRALAYKLAYQAARDKLSERALILIDDTDHIHPWKHTHIVPEARKDGFAVFYTGRQTLLARP